MKTKNIAHFQFIDGVPYEISSETGEIKRLIAISHGDRILRESSQTAFKNRQHEKEKREWEYQNGQHWVGANNGPIRELTRPLLEGEIRKQLPLHLAGVLLKLSMKLQINSNGKLMQEGKQITSQDLIRALNKSAAQAKRIIKELVENEILLKEKIGRNTVFSLNKKYLFMGKRDVSLLDDDLTYTRVFKKRGEKIFENLSDYEAGMLLYVLPFFHCQTYLLSKEPNSNIFKDFIVEDGKDELDYLEEIIETFDYLNEKDLAFHLGLKADTVSGYMDALEKASVVMIIKVGGVVRYLIHPDVMIRKKPEIDGEYNDTYTRMIRVLFKFKGQKEPKKLKKTI